MSPATSTSTKGYALGTRGHHNIAKGMPPPCPIPDFATKEQERVWAKQHMAAAFRVFGRKGFSEGLAGHISIRDPVDPDTFWMNPLAVHFSIITTSDLVHCDEHGNVLPDGNQAAINAAGFAIHSAIHKLRPDVHAACHTHSVYGKAWSAFGKPLAMLNQDACIFYNSHSVYTDFGGVALESDEGVHIAQALGAGKAIILQNHGLLTVGKTVDEAAYLFCLFERTCECQLLAQSAMLPGDKLKVIGDKEAYYTEFNTSDPTNLYASFQSEYGLECKLDPSFLE